VTGLPFWYNTAAIAKIEMSHSIAAGAKVWLGSRMQLFEPLHAAP